MKHYYAYIKGKQIGPFDITELKQQGVTPKTLIWHSELPDWIPANKDPELAEYFSDPSGPPPIDEQIPPPINILHKVQNSRKKKLIYLALGCGLILIVCILLIPSKGKTVSAQFVDEHIRDIRKVVKEEEQQSLEQERLRQIEQEEKEYQKRKKENEQLVRRLQQQEVTIRNTKVGLESEMANLEDQLTDLEIELEQVREWQFLRTRREREAQENAVIRKIMNVNNQYTTLTQRYEQLEQQEKEVIRQRKEAQQFY